MTTHFSNLAKRIAERTLTPAKSSRVHAATRLYRTRPDPCLHPHVAHRRNRGGLARRECPLRSVTITLPARGRSPRLESASTPDKALSRCVFGERGAGRRGRRFEAASLPHGCDDARVGSPQHLEAARYCVVNLTWRQPGRQSLPDPRLRPSCTDPLREVRWTSALVQPEG